MIETLDRKEFDETKKNIDVCYINTEIIMSRNKLLFSDEKDDYQTDQEMLEQLKKEYVDG